MDKNTQTTTDNLECKNDPDYWHVWIIGNFRLRSLDDPTKIWIGKTDGEGGTFNVSEFRDMIDRFYDENF